MTAEQRGISGAGRSHGQGIVDGVIAVDLMGELWRGAVMHRHSVRGFITDKGFRTNRRGP